MTLSSGRRLRIGGEIELASVQQPFSKEMGPEGIELLPGQTELEKGTCWGKSTVVSMWNLQRLLSPLNQKRGPTSPFDQPWKVRPLPWRAAFQAPGLALKLMAGKMGTVSEIESSVGSQRLTCTWTHTHNSLPR